MGKKKVSNLGKLLTLVALVAGIIAFVMMFLDAIKITTDLVVAKSVTTYKGSEVVFGLKEKMGSLEVTILEFNMVALIAFLLPVAGGVIGFLFKNKLFTLIAFLCFVVGAIAMFAFGPIFAIGVETEINQEAVSLGIGTILAGICSVIGALCIGGKMYYSK